MATPTEIRLKKEPRLLVISFDDGSEFEYTFEYLRVHSPSAEVRGHGPGQETLQHGKENVAIVNIEPGGHYAVRLVFDDGHDSGLSNVSLIHISEPTRRKTRSRVRSSA